MFFHWEGSLHSAINNPIMFQRMCLPSQRQWCEEQPVLVSNATPSALKLLLAPLVQKHILLLSQAQEAKLPTDNPSQLPLGINKTGLELVLEELVSMDVKYSLCNHNALKENQRSNFQTRSTIWVLDKHWDHCTCRKLLRFRALKKIMNYKQCKKKER